MNKHLIIYADDDIDDVSLVKDCFKRFEDKVELIIAENGNIALQTLKTMQEQNITPCLIILDVNMPLMDGRQTLVQLKNNADFKNIPVVMFTTSSSRLDKDFAVKWGADFITKPLVYVEVEHLASELVKRCDEEIKGKQ